MNENFFKELGKTAAQKLISDNVSLNESITKQAQQHKLNPNQIARVCEAANLHTYTNKMASSATRLNEFPLADKADILSKLAMTEDPKPVKHAADKAISYFVKSASVNDTSSVFAPEYDVDGSFLKSLSEPDISDISIKTAASKITTERTEHVAKLANKNALVSKAKLKEKLAELDAEKLITHIKLASAIDEAVSLIKQSALSSNPFLLWSGITDPDKAAVADAVFTKAAEELTAFNEKRATELLLEAKKSIPEHDKYILDRNVKIIYKDPILHTIDHISNFKKIIDKIEAFKSCDGINELSSTPQPAVAHSSDKGQPALSYYKKLIDGESK